MKPTVYVETSIISYLTGRDSRDVVTLAKQQQTRAWWDKERTRYALFLGQPVVDEILRGDSAASELRRTATRGLPVLPLTAEAEELALRLVAARVIPQHAFADAYHVGMASAHRLDYLLTWNCKHISNPHTHERMSALIQQAGYRLPLLVSPETIRR